MMTTAGEMQTGGQTTDGGEFIRQSTACRIPGWVADCGSLIILVLLTSLPICFGGVHAKVWLSAHILAFGLAATYLFFARPASVNSFLSGSVSRAVLSGLLIFAAYSIAQWLMLSLWQKPHPVLGFVPLHSFPLHGWNAVSEVVFVAATFFAARIWLDLAKSATSMLCTALSGIAFAVSLIALSHWFYDNGKLFWVFEPDNVFVTQRARWPFVNSNNLGHFLLPLFFLLCARVMIHSSAIKRIATGESFGKREPLSRVISSRRMQSRAIRLFFALVFCGSLLLSIIGTLSRGCWLGLAIGILGFMLLSGRSSNIEGEELASTKITDPHHHSSAEYFEPLEVGFDRISASGKHRRRRSSVNPALALTARVSFLLKPVAIVMALGLFLLFLRGRGQDLFLDRLDYGLMYSKDDLRFQLYRDTLPMISDHFLFGVGPGAWSSEYPRYMSPQLSGLNPVYLHSDPLQLLTESGAAGTLIVIVMMLVALVRIFRRLDHLDRESSLLLTGLLSGLLALMAASLLDFPFHISSISFYFAVLLALIAKIADQAGAVATHSRAMP